MEWRHYQPKSALAMKFINFYWINRHEEENVFNYKMPKLAPYGSTNLLFNFGSEYRYLNDQDEFIVNSHFKGPNLTYYRIDHPGKIDLLGVSFKPYGLYPFTQFPMWRLVNKVLNLAEADPKFLVIDQRLKEITGDEARITAFETELHQLFQDDPDIDEIIRAVNIIYQNKGILITGEIQKELHMSNRTLERKFKKVMGLTPKNYGRLVRFNYALNTVRKNAGVRNWIEIAAKCGYFDQSHFIREFKQFTGNSPKSYLTAKDLLSDYYLPF